MQVNLNTSINQAIPQFKARFSQKDIKNMLFFESNWILYHVWFFLNDSNNDIELV